MVLKIDGEIYVTYTTEGVHNQHYCEGPAIWHHIEKVCGVYDAFDPAFRPDCSAGKSGNIQEPYQLLPEAELPENFRMCQRCAKKMADGDHTVKYIDSVFEIPDHKPPTMDNKPVRHMYTIPPDPAYVGTGVKVQYDHDGEKWVPDRIVYEDVSNTGGPGEWERVDKPAKGPYMKI